jgi:hypothetical protein
VLDMSAARYLVVPLCCDAGARCPNCLLRGEMTSRFGINHMLQVAAMSARLAYPYMTQSPRPSRALSARSADGGRDRASTAALSARGTAAATSARVSRTGQSATPSSNTRLTRVGVRGNRSGDAIAVTDSSSDENDAFWSSSDGESMRGEPIRRIAKAVSAAANAAPARTHVTGSANRVRQ